MNTQPRIGSTGEGKFSPRDCFAAVLLFVTLSGAECVPFDQAGRHIGETKCVTGKVVKVEQGADGVQYLNFCEDYRVCPFSVVVFSSDLKKVGDVRQLEGKIIEIRGEIKEYDNHAEMVLDNPRQLAGEAGPLPAMPRNFDVEQRGNFSAGKFRKPRGRTSGKKRQKPTLPIEIPEDVESE
jgi:hypothetical protein